MRSDSVAILAIAILGSSCIIANTSDVRSVQVPVKDVEWWSYTGSTKNFRFAVRLEPSKVFSSQTGYSSTASARAENDKIVVQGRSRALAPEETELRGRSIQLGALEIAPGRYTIFDEFDGKIILEVEALESATGDYVYPKLGG